MKITRVNIAVGIAWAAAFVASAMVGSMTYFHFGNPQDTCASCHEMGGMHSAWSASGHRTLHCRNCHGGSLTLDAHALKAHVKRVVQHFGREPDQPIRLTERDVLTVHQACISCHPQAFADWNSSRHTTNYARIFLDPEHNHKELVASDCLRCHGMFFDRDVDELVTPLNKTGPWELRDPAKAAQPAIPCLACHQVHTATGESQPAHFYDRREGTHFSAKLLPVVPVHGAAGTVRSSLDPRQRICVQCHAPDARHQLGTGDDRTPTGAHEGLSCLDCHGTHSTSARASCAACHPANSHCGLDVEKMDTSFLSGQSRHNIHTVSCRDCHPGGVPAKTTGK